MTWNASGAERVKGYRLYQELEAKYHESMDRVAELERAISFKDSLIRSLAAEIAMLPKVPTNQDAQHLYEEASEAYAKTVSGSGARSAERPGAYSSAGSAGGVDDGTAEVDPPQQEVSVRFVR